MRKHRSIKILENDALFNNNIKAQHQLYSNYKNGDFVEQSDEEANKYLNMLEENFKTTKLRLKNIRLINFRGFSDLSIDLSTDYIVIAANNGYGKTGVLESIYNCLTWTLRNFKANGGNGHFIKVEDIRSKKGINSASVVLDVSLIQGGVENSTYSINLSKTSSESEEKQESFYQEFKYLAELYRDLGSSGYSVPVFAFYSVERGSAIKKSDFKKTAEELNRDFGSNDYALTISNAPKFEAFLTWILNEKTKKSVSYANDEDLKELNSNIKALEVLKNLESNDPKILRLIEDFENSIEKATSLESFNEDKIFSDKLNMVFSAIYTFMPEVKKLSFEYDEKNKSIDLFCIKNECKISVTQLSQGEKTMLSLVCDISLRLISANFKSVAPFDGDGIIVIDEIDLHLHPLWQQTILLRLRDTFPNIQFIISTHSSNVLSTASHECIRRISESVNGVSGNYNIEVPYFSLGAETSTLQEEIQGVPSRPNSVLAVQKLNLYKELVVKDEWDSPEAEKLFNEICDLFEGRDPITTKLRLDVALRKKRREKK